MNDAREEQQLGTTLLSVRDEAPSAGRRILVADDDPAIRRLVEVLAKREQIECDGASNGVEAVAALKARDYALLFLDIMMPRVDGWGVLDYLRTRARERVPALFVITAFLNQAVSAADRAIVSGILYKPVDADDLAALMRECVRGGSAVGCCSGRVITSRPRRGEHHVGASSPQPAISARRCCTSNGFSMNRPTGGQTLSSACAPNAVMTITRSSSSGWCSIMYLTTPKPSMRGIIRSRAITS